MKKSRKKRKKYIRVIIKRIIFSSLFLFSLILFFIFSARIPLFHVERVAVQKSGDAYYERELRDFSSSLLKENVLYLFPRESRIFTRIGFRDKLKSRFPELTQFSFSFQKKVFTIAFEKRKESFIVCEQQIEEKEKHCFFGDENGFLFREAPDLSDSLFHTMYVENSLHKGMYFLDKERLENLFSLIHTLEADGSHHIERIFIFSDEGGDVFLKIQFDEFLQRECENPLSLYLSFPRNKDDINKVLQKISVLKKVELFEKEFFKEKKNLEYIDFRIPHQIRYKLYLEKKEEE